MAVPKLRFPEFTDEWEQRKFGELFVERREKTKTENEDVLLSCAINGMFLNSELFGHFRGSSTIGYLKVKRNDLILSAQNLHLGNANVNMRFDSGIISPAYKVYDIIGCTPEFAQAWVKQEKTKQFFLSATTEGASQCRKNIEWNTLYNQEIAIPSFDEQEKIGGFISAIDNTIALQQRELTALENQKRAAMQKIFSQEVRFKKDDGSEYPEWVDRRIGDICSVSTGKSNTQDKIDEGQYPFYVRSPIIEHSDTYLFDEEAVITVGDGVGTGKVFHYVHGKYNLHQRCYRMYDFDEVSAKFFYYVFSKKFHKRIKSMSAKTSVDSVRMEMITDMVLSIPCLKEQQKIANFLTDIDSAIDLAEQELEKWKTLKKGLLQQMFV